MFAAIITVNNQQLIKSVRAAYLENGASAVSEAFTRYKIDKVIQVLCKDLKCNFKE